MTQEEWEGHPIFAVFIAKVLAQLSGLDEEVLMTSVRCGRPVIYDDFYNNLGV